MTLVIIGSVPAIFLRPHVGILMWCWIGYMNPHRLTWGFAYDFRFAMLLGAVTIVAWLLSREPKRLPAHPITFLLFALALWFTLTTIFALAPDVAVPKWEKATKIILMTFVTMVLMGSRERIHALVWLIVVSISFFGLKGGLYTILGGGEGLVWGPPGGFFADNNGLAVALIMALPLMRYLQLHSQVPWIRWGLGAVMLASGASIIGSYSRGAFLAGIAMLLVLLVKSRRRLPLTIVTALALAAATAFVPHKWVERMATITTYEEDSSTRGRIYAWTFAVKLALDKPIVGGGFEVNQHEELFLSYVPEAEKSGSFHSIYFQMLGEHGFVGLALFLLLGLSALGTGARIIREARGRPDLQWARDLAALLQVSLIGYAVGGMFLNLGIFDLYYNLVVVMLLVRMEVKKARMASTVEQVGGTAGSKRVLTPGSG